MSTAADVAALKSTVSSLQANADAFFLIVNSMIIFFMQCGFAFLECGAVRSKNATNILIKNMLDSFMGAVAYWLVGYPLAFGVRTVCNNGVCTAYPQDGNPFLGIDFWASSDISQISYAHWFFHFVFAATAATIVSGAVAERCEFSAYVFYSIVITGFMYPVVSHWAWSGPDAGNGQGWLNNGIEFTSGNTTLRTSYMDFAGSGVVHLLGGTAALVASAILGPRIGRFDEDKEANDIRGHSVPLASLGGFILFFGFFAFNGGSQASISQPGDGAVVALSVVNTIISGSFAGITALLIQRITTSLGGGKSKWSLLGTINGGLTGMVAICAGCNVLYPWAAAVIGFVSGITYLTWSSLLLKAGLDDPLDAVAVHGGGGLWGIIATPILMKEAGIVYEWSKVSFMALGWNLVGAVAIIAWSGVISLILFGLMRAFGIYRAPRDVEKKGMDIPKHGEPAYPLGSYGDGWHESAEDFATTLQGRRMSAAATKRSKGASRRQALCGDNGQMAVLPGYQAPVVPYYPSAHIAQPYDMYMTT